jgi:cell division protease FtsH
MDQQSGDNSPGPSNNKPSDGQAGDPRRRNFGTMIILGVIGFALVMWMFYSSPSNYGSTVPYSFVKKQLQADNIDGVRFQQEFMTGEWRVIPESPKGFTGKLSKKFNTVLPPERMRDNEFVADLDAKGVQVESTPTAVDNGTQLLIWILLPLGLIFILWTIMRRSSDPFSSGGMMGSFVRSPARRFEKSDKAATFEDVAGLKNAKQDLQEVVEFLKTPKKFTKLGAKIPKGVLLVGPPGTGKTLLARATAGEAGVPFFAINGSEFIQMFVGVGATRVRDLFKTAREASPCIIFIDEIDAVGRVRGAGVGGGHDEREQTLNQILSEMDGFQLRPGRFDRHVTVDKPAREGRLGILKVHSRKVPLAEDVELDCLARTTIGYSGADLEKLVNEAALKAAREDKRTVEMVDFLYAQDLILMGAPRDEPVELKERDLTAWHEAGHAILAWCQKGMDPVHKISIVPRGRSLGVTQLMPEKELYNVGEHLLKARLVMMMGGRAAEKLVFDEFSAGAEDDIDRSTRLARRMVASWGMSEAIGPVAFRQSEEHPFLGKEMHTYREFSEETARLIDVEVQKIMHEAHASAVQLLKQYREKLDTLAAALLEAENLERDEVAKILGERPFDTSEDE